MRVFLSDDQIERLTGATVYWYTVFITRSAYAEIKLISAPSAGDIHHLRDTTDYAILVETGDYAVVAFYENAFEFLGAKSITLEGFNEVLMDASIKHGTSLRSNTAHRFGHDVQRGQIDN